MPSSIAEQCYLCDGPQTCLFPSPSCPNNSLRKLLPTSEVEEAFPPSSPHSQSFFLSSDHFPLLCLPPSTLPVVIKLNYLLHFPPAVTLQPFGPSLSFIDDKSTCFVAFRSPTHTRTPIPAILQTFLIPSIPDGPGSTQSHTVPELSSPSYLSHLLLLYICTKNEIAMKSWFLSSHSHISILHQLSTYSKLLIYLW